MRTRQTIGVVEIPNQGRRIKFSFFLVYGVSTLAEVFSDYRIKCRPIKEIQASARANAHWMADCLNAKTAPLYPGDKHE